MNKYLKKANQISNSGIIRLFVRHKTAANLLMFALILLGFAGLMKLNTQLMPTIKINFINVSVSWDGAAPEDVEASILRPLEAEFQSLENLESRRSYATEGNGGVTLRFTSNANMTEALSSVERAVSAVTNLPAEADKPNITKIEFYEPVASISISGPFGEKALNRFAQDIRDGLLAAGIDKIDYQGKRDEEIAVKVNQQLLEKNNLTLSDVAQKITSGTQDRPSGNLEGETEKALRLFGVGQSVTDMGNIEMSVGQKGDRILLRDIADINKQFDPDQQIGVMGDKRAIVLEIKRTAASDTLKTMETMNKYLEKIKPTLPPSLEVKTFNVTGIYVQERINLLVNNGLSGLVLVAIVLFLFLNSRIAFWVAAGVPVAIMATLAVMYLFGTSINMISMFALIMMLGIIVDDAIVVAEETETQIRLGHNSMDAAQLGAERMMRPVLAAAITTIAAFIPLAVIGGFMGQIMITFPIVVISVLVASLIECFFILPGHLRHVNIVKKVPTFKKRSLFKDGFFGSVAFYFNAYWFVLKLIPYKLRKWFDRGFEFFRDKMFKPFAAFSYRWRWATVATSFAAFIIAIAFVTSGKVAFDFFPSAESERIEVAVEFSSGTELEVMKEDIQKIENALNAVELELGGYKSSLVDTVFTTLSRQGDPIAEINVQLVKSEARDVRTKTITEAWENAVPVLSSVEDLTIGEGNTAGGDSKDIDYRFSGGSLEVLKAAADEFQELAGALPGVTGLDDDFPVGKRELVLKLTPRGGALGFSIDNISRQLRQGFQSVTARSFPTADGDVNVKVSIDEQEGSMSSLRRFKLRAPAGQFVELAEVVSISEKSGATLIRKNDGKISIKITGNVNAAVATGDQIRREIETNIVPAIEAKYGVEKRVGGRGKDQADAFRDMQIGGMLAFSLIYITLAWVFASYTRPIVVMMIIPFGFVGALFGHLIMGFNLTMMSVFGLLGLAGILVNDSIILVARIEEYLKAGATMYHAAVHGAKDRLRAVLLTSLTTIGGLTPLMFEKSLQAQFLIPLAVTMVFGLLAATVLVLILVPATLGVMHDIGNFFSWVWNGRNWRQLTKRPQ